jgi:hypothetical protein
MSPPRPSASPYPLLPTSTTQIRSNPWGLTITILIAIVAMFCLVSLFLLWRLNKLGVVSTFLMRKPRNTNPYNTGASANPYDTDTELVPPPRPKRRRHLRSNSTADSHVDGQSDGYGIAPSPIPPSWEPASLAGTNTYPRERACDGYQTPPCGTPS